MEICDSMQDRQLNKYWEQNDPVGHNFHSGHSDQIVHCKLLQRNRNNALKFIMGNLIPTSREVSTNEAISIMLFILCIIQVISLSLTILEIMNERNEAAEEKARNRARAQTQPSNA